MKKYNETQLWMAMGAGFILGIGWGMIITIYSALWHSPISQVFCSIYK